MDVITVSPPRLDPEDIPGSFQRMSDYFREVMELIDNTLWRYGGRLKTADADGVAQLLNDFRAELVGIQRDLVSGDNRMNTQDKELGQVTDRVTSLEALAGQVAALEASLTGLEERVKALEEKSTT